MRAFFAKGTDQTKADYSVPLLVNNCGYYRDLERDVCVSRPKGRQDYQLIFVARGTLEICGRELRDGDAYVFLPGEKQEYVYKADCKCSYYWAHFCGSYSRELARDYGLKGLYSPQRNASEVERVFRLMVAAYEDDLKSKELVSTGCLLTLLALVSDLGASGSPFKRAEQRLKDCRDDVSIAQLARSQNMSEAHFIRSFKSYNGLTPRAYALKYRMEQAQSLLSDSDMSVGEIAAACGYADSLYFGRLFKKYIGLSPCEYRKRLQ